MINRYDGTCATCREGVRAGDGHVRNENGRWVTYCRDHFPEQIVVRNELTVDGFLYFSYSPEAVSLVRSLPGKPRFNGLRGPDAAWIVSLENADRPRLLEVCDKLNISVPPVLRQYQQSSQAVQANLDGLYDFQVTGVDFLAQHTHALLADDMGLGKTVQTLRALTAGDSVLVVCPATLKYNWRNEIARWAPGFVVTLLDSKSEFSPPAAGEIKIINFESLPKTLLAYKKWQDVVAYKQSGNAWERTTLVVDEAHRAKNTKSQVHAKISFLSQVCKRAWLLTGTPLMNRATDLWGTLRVGNLHSEVFGRGKWGWEKFQELFNAVKTRYGTEYGNAKPEVAERLRRVMLRRNKIDVLPQLPRKTYQHLVVNGMSASLKKTLDDLWAEFADQIAAGELPPFEAFSQVRAELARERIPAVQDFVSDYEEQGIPLLVFSAHKAPVEAVGAREGWATITGDTPPEERAAIVQQFQAGNLKGVALTVQAGGVGLTLTRASTVLFVDLDWTPALNAQAEDRVCRIGQTASSIQIFRMVSLHEMDEHVLRLLERKIELIQSAIEASVQVTGAPRNDVETPEQYQARMAAIETAAVEAERVAAEERQRQLQERAAREIDHILARQMARAERPERELTEEVKQAIPEALGYLLDRCDGAAKRDGMGFSKPDVFTSRLIAATGFSDDRSYRAGERLLSRYYRQLHTVFPVLFGG